MPLHDPTPAAQAPLTGFQVYACNEFPQCPNPVHVEFFPYNGVPEIAADLANTSTSILNYLHDLHAGVSPAYALGISLLANAALGSVDLDLAMADDVRPLISNLQASRELLCKLINATLDDDTITKLVNAVRQCKHENDRRQAEDPNSTILQ